jgi:hypothetical protein
MAKIQDTDLLVINRGGVDYKSPKSELGIPTKVGELENDKGYITAGEVPNVDLDSYATEEWVLTKNYITLAEVPYVDLDGYATEEWVEDKNYITLAEVPEVDLDGYATEEWVLTKNYITLEDVPEPDLEGALIFKGNVENEAALPDDASQGDMYYNEADEHLYAKGETEWYKLATVDDIDLSKYAKLDDDEQSITAKEFIGDGSQLTNLPGSDSGIEEAPSDGEIYGRKDSKWEKLAFMPYDITTLPQL